MYTCIRLNKQPYYEVTDIEQALGRLFNYKRNQDPLKAELIRKNRVQGISHLDVKVSSDVYGFEGNIPFLGLVRIGFQEENTLGFYTAEKEIYREGPKLPGIFSDYNDCPYIHLGVLMNCLALMQGGRIGRLALIKMEGCEIMTLMIKPAIAEFFMANLSQISKPEQETRKKKMTAKERKRFVDPNQVSMFSAGTR